MRNYVVIIFYVKTILRLYWFIDFDVVIKIHSLFNLQSDTILVTEIIIHCISTSTGHNFIEYIMCIIYKSIL